MSFDFVDDNNEVRDEPSSTSSLIRNFSKTHTFEDLPEQRNATEGNVLKF